MYSIFATDELDGFSHHNELTVRSKTDMKWFQSQTINQIVIMGYKTFESLNFTPLDNRVNIVLCRDEMIRLNEDFVCNYLKQNHIDYVSETKFVPSTAVQKENITLVNNLYKSFIICHRVYDIMKMHICVHNTHNIFGCNC